MEKLTKEGLVIGYVENEPKKVEPKEVKEKDTTPVNNGGKFKKGR